MTKLTPFLHKEIIPRLKTAKEIRIAVAMMNEYVLQIFEETLPKTCAKKYLVGINLPTPPEVLNKLLELRQANPGIIQAKVYKAKENYHPKVYIITHEDDTYTTLLGSANATRGGWFNNVEMNSIHQEEQGIELLHWFNDLFEKGIEFDEAFIDRYTKVYFRNKLLERSIRSNLDNVYDEEAFDEKVFPPANVQDISEDQFFQVSDFEAYAPANHENHGDASVARRKQVSERLKELDSLISPKFRDNGIHDLFPHPDRQFRTARFIKPIRGNIRDAIWLHYGKHEQELELYRDEKYKEAHSFSNHIRIQVILRHTARTAFIGTWIYIGKGGGSIRDRQFIQDRLDSAGFLTTLLKLLKELGASYYLDIGAHLIKISEIQTEKRLREFLVRDKQNEFRTDFKLGRNFNVDHPDLRTDKIVETTLLEFSRLYSIYQMFRHRMPVIKTPKECDASELDGFRELAREGGQVSVSEEQLIKNIDNCRYLAFQYIGAELVGISAIRVSTIEKVRNGPFEKAKIANVSNDDLPLLELDYSVTKSEYRGNGINSMLNDHLLSKIKGTKVYATTGVASMKKYLTKRGFEEKGEPWDSKKNSNIRYYEKVA